MMLHSGIVIDSQNVTWASVPSPSHVVAPVSRCGEGGNKSAGLRPEEVGSSAEEMKSLESGAEFESAGNERQPTNVDVESEESADKAPYIFHQGALSPVPAAAPVDRVA